MLWAVNMALAASPWTIDAPVADAIRAVADRPVGERIDAATRPFLGLPYQNDAAGEGVPPDLDPPARYDRFDCLTFVEEALAMVLAADPVDAPELREVLRYHGPASYTTRNHFMEAQWIPGAIEAGLLVDITDRVGRARTLRKEVTPEVWRNWRGRWRFSLDDLALPLGAWTLRYLDLAEAANAVPLVPPGSVVVTLRVERAWSPVVTTHVSLVVPGASEPMMRHATRMGKQVVRDDRLGWYMDHLRDYVNWPALGVAILAPVEQGPRLSALFPDPWAATPFPPAEGGLPSFTPSPIAPSEPPDDPSE